MLEQHPYGEFIPPQAEAMIVGSFPIAKFSNPELRSEIKPHEYDFFFGGEKNLLWRLLGRCFAKELRSTQDVMAMLTEQRLAMGDVIKACERKNNGSSDSDLIKIHWNHNLLAIIKENRIQKIYFTLKKVEQWFNKLFPHHQLQSVTLISPSAQSFRALGRNPQYLKWKKQHPQGKSLDFIFEQYRGHFLTQPL